MFAYANACYCYNSKSNNIRWHRTTTTTTTTNGIIVTRYDAQLFLFIVIGYHYSYSFYQNKIDSFIALFRFASFFLIMALFHHSLSDK